MHLGSWWAFAPEHGNHRARCEVVVVPSPIVTTQLPGAGATLGGDFRIERQLGAGGMGAVYVAEQISTGRRRALKLMHPSLVSDAKLRERFEQEARVGARIPSDHVVQVIAAGVDEATGSPFIAMELLDGEDLAATMNKRGALPPEDVRAILQPVCHALGAAHNAGIVHRDLKPENIFLLHTRDVQRTFDVKLLDFGIAKLTADARTMATSAVGTPLWMAPEQTDPRAKIAPTADIWPLALLVFSMLTGRSYWRVASDPSVSVQALMREILFEPVDAPSVRAVEFQIDVPLPEGFDAWFLRCLDRDAAKRFPTANEAWEALVPVLGAELRSPATLAALRTASMTTDERAKFETAPTAASLEMAATAPVGGLSGMEATVDASKLAAVAASAHSTNLSVGKTDPAAAPKPSKLRAVGAVAAAALVGVISWQVATSRAERLNAANQETQTGNGSSRESSFPAPGTDLPGIGPANGLGPRGPGPGVFPDVPLPPPPPLNGSGFAPAAPPMPPAPPAVPVVPAQPKATASAGPKLGPFDTRSAQRSADTHAGNVKHICGRTPGPGPRAFSLTVTFNPTGRVAKVRANVQAPAPVTLCAESVMIGAVAPPFDPTLGPGVVVVSVSLD